VCDDPFTLSLYVFSGGKKGKRTQIVNTQMFGPLPGPNEILDLTVNVPADINNFFSGTKGVIYVHIM
jgi:hypothetical protein